MYIEFDLPTNDRDSQHTYYALSVIREEIQDWLEKHPVESTQKTIKYKHRLAFNDDRNYTLFALTWNPKSWNQKYIWIQYRLIEPMKVDTN
jgi:hypothetical protein